jgi:hypothetical protein
VELIVFQTNASGTFQEDHWYILPIYSITAFGCHTFQRLEKKQKKNLAKKDPKFPQNLRLISLLPTTGKLFKKVILKYSKDTLKEETCLMKVSLVFVLVTARHFKV